MKSNVLHIFKNEKHEYWLNVKMNYTLTSHELFVSAMLGSNANAAIIDLIV
jgi:hypothetical protein